MRQFLCWWPACAGREALVTLDQAIRGSNPLSPAIGRDERNPPRASIVRADLRVAADPVVVSSGMDSTCGDNVGMLRVPPVDQPITAEGSGSSHRLIFRAGAHIFVEQRFNIRREV